MKLDKFRGYRANSNILSGILYNNPLLVLGLGLTFAVGTATTLKHALAVSISIFATLIPCAVISSLLPQKLPSYLKNILLVIIASLALLPASIPISAISPDIFDSLGMYFPILAANSLLVSKFIQHGVVGRVKVATYDAVKSSIGYSLAIFLIAAIREYFAFGTLWGIDMDAVFVLQPLSLPFSGFIIVGFVAAFFRVFERMLRKYVYINSKKYGEQ